MTIVHAALTGFIGDTVELPFDYHDADDNPLSLVGAAIEWKLADMSGLVIFTNTGANGIAVVDADAGAILLGVMPEETATSDAGNTTTGMARVANIDRPRRLRGGARSGALRFICNV